jgi:GDSL-like Lipase/Acylhydrolase family
MSRQLFEYHPVLGYRFVPNLKARVPHESGGYLVQANECGFRSNRAFTEARDGDRKRVLLFGDSFTAGDGVSNGRRYSEGVESRLAHVEVYNYGLSGTGTDQQYLAWREFGRAVEHDLVVIAVLVENVRRVTARYRRYQDADGHERVYAKPYYTLDGDALSLHHSPPRKEPYEERELPPEEREAVDRGGRFALLRQVVSAVGAKDVVQRLTRYQPVPDFDSPTHPGWRLMRAILEMWIRASERPVMLVPLPLYQHIEETSDAGPYQARFRELSADLGCALHDPLPDLMSYPMERRRRFRFEKDVHPTPEGHDALAASLAPAIARVLANPSR